MECGFFLSSPSLLSLSSSSSSEDKEIILNIFKDLINEKVITKEGKGKQIIEEVIIQSLNLEKESREKKELTDVGKAASEFLKATKKGGWKEFEGEKKNIEEYEEEIERLKKEKKH